MPKARANVPAFWAIADELIATSQADEGTLMGMPCLRVNGAFFATAGHTSDELIVKLTRDRVDTLLAEGIGQPFAPAGRRFREWLAVPAGQQHRWGDLIDEARTLAGGR